MIIVIFIIVAIIIWRLLCSTKAKGRRGEKKVSLYLNMLPSNKYIVLNDIMLENKFGRTCQIDHIVLSIYGVFVIETKNYKGWIFGGEHSEEWTQNIYGKKFNLRNPILQNYGHEKVLRRLLSRYGNFPIYSIVAFSRKCTLKVHVNESCVIYFNQILHEIKSHRQKFFDFSVVKIMASYIKQYDVSDKKGEMQKHVKNIKMIVKKKEDDIRNGICPRCGAPLVDRKGKFGRFRGCSNYPICKFTCEI